MPSFRSAFRSVTRSLVGDSGAILRAIRTTSSPILEGRNPNQFFYDVRAALGTRTGAVLSGRAVQQRGAREQDMSGARVLDVFGSPATAGTNQQTGARAVTAVVATYLGASALGAGSGATGTAPASGSGSAAAGGASSNIIASSGGGVYGGAATTGGGSTIGTVLQNTVTTMGLIRALFSGQTGAGDTTITAPGAGDGPVIPIDVVTPRGLDGGGFFSGGDGSGGGGVFTNPLYMIGGALALIALLYVFVFRR